MSNGTLINHCGAKLVAKGDLELIPAPPPTATWFPIRHLDVLESVEETLDKANFGIKSCHFSVSKQGIRDSVKTDSVKASRRRSAWDKGIVGTRMLRPLLNEWRSPSYEDFESRTAWSMLSAYTHIAKDRQRRYPNKSAHEVMSFQSLLAA